MVIILSKKKRDVRKKMNIAAVVVTFNRKDYLIECLNGLLSQTTKLDKIYIIDNNSSDGTHELLKTHGFLSNSIFEYHNTNANTGGAGGFAFGMEIAFKQSHDWYWLMDDDVEPKSDALEILLNYSHHSRCIHPRKIFSDGSPFLWDGKFFPRTIRTKWFTPERRDKRWGFSTVNYGCFEGMLIHDSIVRKIGMPDKRYFIHTDDLSYGYLASLHTPVIYVHDSIFEKKIKKDETTDFFGIKVPYLSGFNQYFNLRNHFLLRETLIKYNSTNKPVSFIYACLKFIKLYLTSMIVHKNKKDAKMIWWGFIDGLNKNYQGHKRFIK